MGRVGRVVWGGGRRRLGVVALVVVGLALGACMPAPDGTEAATYAVDARHSGASASRLSDEPVVRWRHRWDNDTGGTQVVSAVSSGDLVVAGVERQIDWVPTVDVVAFDRSSGETRWTARFPRSVGARLALANGRVFVSSLDNPLTGLPETVRALDLRTGAVLWAQRPPRAFATNATPTPAGTDLYITSGTTIEGQLHALDQRTGAVRWTRTWVDMGGVDAMSPTVAGDAVIVGHACIFRSLRRSDGVQLWQSTLNPCANPTHGIAADATRAYVASANPDPGRILDLATGNVVGTFPASSDPVVTADTIYTGTIEVIEAHALGTGARRWRHELVERTNANRVVIGQHLFYLDLTDGELVGLSTVTGEPALAVPLGHADTGTPGFMNAGNGLVLISYGSELIIVS